MFIIRGRWYFHKSGKLSGMLRESESVDSEVEYGDKEKCSCTGGTEFGSDGWY